jgi:hypothetical protein
MLETTVVRETEFGGIMLHTKEFFGFLIFEAIYPAPWAFGSSAAIVDLLFFYRIIIFNF